MYGGHALALRVKGLFKHPGVPVLQPLVVHPKGLGQEDEGPLGGVADDLPGPVRVQAGVVAQGGSVHQLPVHLRVAAGGLLHRGDGPRLKVPVHRDVGDGHPVQRQSARLVGADHRGAAQGLHRGQAADEGVLFGHALHAQGHNDGGRGGQALRDDGDGQGDGHQELGHQGPLVQGADGEDQHAHDQPRHGENLAYRVQLPLQGGVRVVLAVQHPGDLAHLGVHPGGHHHAHAPAIGHDGRAVGHVAPVAQGAVLGQKVLRLLLSGDGLAGDGGLLHLQVGGVYEAQVRRDHIPVAQEHHVAHHQLGGGDHALLPLAQHPGGGGAHPPQGLQGGLGLFLLNNADDGIDNDNGEDHRRLCPLPQEGGEGRRPHQDQHHGVQDLGLEHLKNGLGRLGAQFIAPVLFQPSGSLGVAQSLRRGVQRLVDFFQALSVPRPLSVTIHVGSITPFCFLIYSDRQWRGSAEKIQTGIARRSNP